MNKQLKSLHDCVRYCENGRALNEQRRETEVSQLQQTLRSHHKQRAECWNMVSYQKNKLSKVLLGII